jgi:cytoskeletal protein CcmA (bactofilin family)
MIGGKKPDFSNMTGSKGSSGDALYTLGEGSEFEGKLKFEGTARVDGKFKGEIHSTGTLIIGERAEVEGDIDVGSCVIIGRYEGTITASTKLEMHTPAIVKANITAPILVIQEGVTFDGNCQTSGRASQETVDSKGAPEEAPKKSSSAPEQPELIN